MSIWRKLAGFEDENKSDAPKPKVNKVKYQIKQKVKESKAMNEIDCQKQKYCSQCGSVISEADKFCGGCGAKIIKRKEAYNEKIEIVEKNNNSNKIASVQQNSKSMPLKYLLFYIYVGLPLGILYNLFYLLAPYPYATQAFLSFYTTISIIVSIVLIVGLHLRKLWAWKLNIVMMILGAIMSIIVVITEFDNFFQIVFIGILVSLVFLAVLWPNWIYFRKRKHLFH